MYAFTFDGTPRYVGRSVGRSVLHSRLEQYQYGTPNASDTHNRVKREITLHLNQGGEVDIWVAQPDAIAELRGRAPKVSSCQRLEELLIKELRLDLNVAAPPSGHALTPDAKS